MSILSFFSKVSKPPLPGPGVTKKQGNRIQIDIEAHSEELHSLKKSAGPLQKNECKPTAESSPDVMDSCSSLPVISGVSINRSERPLPGSLGVAASSANTNSEDCNSKSGEIIHQHVSLLKGSCGRLFTIDFSAFCFCVPTLENLLIAVAC